MKTLSHCNFMHAVHTSCRYSHGSWDTASCGFCFATALQFSAPIDVPLSKVVFFWCGKFYPPVWYVALSAVEEVLYVAIGWALGWQKIYSKNNYRCRPVSATLCRCLVMVICVFLCVERQTRSKKSLHWMCQRMGKNVLPETLWGRLWGAVFRVCQYDLSSMHVWPTPGQNASFRIQIHAVKKSGTTSSELCHAFAFKTRGKRRLWRKKKLHWYSSAI